MVKRGRNDRCHCGSGKKYKKCCMEKDQQQGEQQPMSADWKTVEGRRVFNHLSYEEVDAMDTDDIIDRLKKLGVPFEKDAFLEDVETFYTAEEISESWFEAYDLVINGRMEDFPWFAAWVLWVRMAPEENLSMEQLDQLLNRGIEYVEADDYVTGCDLWLRVWEGMTYRIDPTQTDLEYLGEHYDGAFSVQNFVQDLEMELENAGLRNPIYFEKRITFCKEFCRFFPDEDELIIHNMRRAIADSYGGLGQFDKAEAEYRQLVNDFPDNHWSYTAWGDLLFMDKKQDYLRAKEIYEKALVIVKNSGDRTEEETVKERLADLKQEM